MNETMQVADLAQTANLIFGFDPKVIATAVVVICYIILFYTQIIAYIQRKVNINADFGIYILS